MMSKPLKIALPAFILLLGIGLYIGLTSFTNVAAQTQDSLENFTRIIFHGPLGRFKWCPLEIEVNFSRAKEYRVRLRQTWGLLEISEEFKNIVVNIAKSDPDVENMLSEGYNITRIQPIIRRIVEADGTVITKAKSAVLTLRKDTSGMAFVWVDVENSKVTRIEIITRTVIVKP
ncbi:MAG: hypothetical protein FGF51_00360 [Candidatus Brockarchaeota archaeon]|nr:hypothetical protein [Candidatus Brockarchaeota archaeon]